MPQPRILVIEDDRDLREALAEIIAAAGYAVAAVADGEAGLELLGKERFNLTVTDVNLPGMNGYEVLRRINRQAGGAPVLIITAYGTIADAVGAMQAGAVDYLVKPFAAETLLQKIAQLAPAGAAETPEFIAEDPASLNLIATAEKVARTSATVLISGESGTGKEVLARFIHKHSARAAGPFIAINCAAIPENMLEAILFGYEKGAFTGAAQATMGKFEQAQGGTLLLDEISEMDLALQAKLLRVLQEREIERLGGKKPIPLDVRVLATTNRDLPDAVRQNRFREDLFYRLNVFPLTIAPLRERPRDILPLAAWSLGKGLPGDGCRAAPELSATAREALLSHAWPGNVRELDNLMQRVLVMHKGGPIQAGDLGLTVTGRDAPARHAQPLTQDADGLGEKLRQEERELILAALAAERGSRKQAAARLGISPRTLRYKLAQIREAGVAIAV